MQQPLIPQRAVFAVLLAAVLLPITICVVLAVAVLLDRMGDTFGGVLLDRLAILRGIVWVVDLISLVLLQAVGTLKDHNDPDENG